MFRNLLQVFNCEGKLMDEHRINFGSKEPVKKTRIRFYSFPLYEEVPSLDDLKKAEDIIKSSQEINAWRKGGLVRKYFEEIELSDLTPEGITTKEKRSIKVLEHEIEFYNLN